ncbi:DNA-binding CsgD family transcriptional regulator [Bradyrhizobium sp. USDA 4354]
MADVDEKEVVLSERERQCLRWVEKGKSSWSIGVILKVSENTVNFHIKNAMAKARNEHPNPVCRQSATSASYLARGSRWAHKAVDCCGEMRSKLRPAN